MHVTSNFNFSEGIEKCYTTRKEVSKSQQVFNKPNFKKRQEKLNKKIKKRKIDNRRIRFDLYEKINR